MYIYAGVFSRGDSVSLNNVYGFKSKQECMAAGKQSEDLVKLTAKEFRFTCLEQK